MKKNITKLLIGTITEKEIIELHDWLRDPKNQTLLESYIRDYHDLNLATLKNNLDEAYNKVSHQIDLRDKPIKKLFPNWAKYAAAVVLLFGLALLYQEGYFSSQDQKVIVPKNESITLVLDNGAIQTIDVTSMKEVKDSEGNVVGTQKQNEISYSQSAKRKDLVYNTINIPNGKKFQLVLSDGTVVHLNAGSSLKYPVNFLEEGPRQVFLEGEAYFDVVRNEANAFIVNVEELDVRVLGTEFNISSYGEDEHIDVVLVKGAVRLNMRDNDEVNFVELSPGQKGSYAHSSKNISINEVNTTLYTSWMQGHLVFRDLAFNSILKKLERHYNLEIVNTNEELGREIFNASFNDVEIETVLSYFNDSHAISYSIEGNKIIIK